VSRAIGYIETDLGVSLRMTNSVLFLASPFAVAIFAALVKRSFDMRDQKRHGEMWGSIFWSLIPLAIVAAMWGSTGDMPMLTRNIVLGVIGAPVGAAFLIWIGYLAVPTKVVAQTEPPPTAASTATGPVGIKIIGDDKGGFIGNQITVGSMKGVSSALEVNGGNVQNNKFEFGTVETITPKTTNDTSK
jgi:hypothetical protein